MNGDHPSLRVSLLTLGDPEQVTGGYLYHRRMAEHAPAQGAELRFVSVEHRPFLLSLLDGRRAVRSGRTTGTHVMVVDSIAAAFAAPWLRADARCPAVGVLHQPPGGIDGDGPVRALQAALDRAAWGRVRSLIVAGDHLADQLVALGVDERRIRVVPPGRDVGTPPAGPPPDLRHARRAAFVCVGNWVPRKGIVDLLDAFAALPEDAATLHLVGDDRTDPSYAAKVRARLGRPDVGRRVVVHGVVPRDRVAALYAAADAFVLPATREPYGTVWAEAMAAGLPVVGWNAANLPYLATHEREGLLVPTGDVPGLTAALLRLAEDVEGRRRMAEAAELKAAAFPTWRRTAELFFGALRDAVAGAAR